MVKVDQSEPADIVDRLLWQDAQQMLGRHAEPGPDGTCVWCGWRWPARRAGWRNAPKPPRDGRGGTPGRSGTT